jgi:hypothetical protein
MKALLKNWLLQTSIFFLCKSKQGILPCLLFLLAFTNNAQIANYVNNGGFENTYTCTVSNFSLKNVIGWNSLDSINSSFGGVYTNYCNVGMSCCEIPLNTYSYQFPKNGSAFALGQFFCPTCAGPPRGFMKNRLKEKLISGKAYCSKMYINHPHSCLYGIDALGMYYGGAELDTITTPNQPLPYLTPQVQNPSGNILVDTLNWVAITNTFIATGNEKYLVIGCFKSDASVNYSVTNSGFPQWSGYNIDDVSCIPLDLPAYAAPGPDIWAIPGATTYVGRQQDVGIDEACQWFKLPNTTSVIANVAGLTLTVAATTETYMVKQDICGVIKYDTVVVHGSGVDVVTLSGVEGLLQISPNPASELLTIESNVLIDDDDLQIKIFNNLGQLIRKEEIIFRDRNSILNIRDLPNGIYTISFITSDNFIINKRIVISR